jgi:predicted phosphoribosyltransferase
MDRAFTDRRQAGRQLAVALRDHEIVRKGDAVVLALPRGGVPVGFEIATALDVPLAVFVVRKLGVPGYRELAMGAIASGGVRILNDEVVRELRIPEYAIDRIAQEEERELQRRERMYNGPHPLPSLSGRTAIIVDDGLATGSTMRAAVEAVRKHEPKAIVVAAPVGAADTCAALRAAADAVVCLRTPEPFQAVGLWYEHFDQTTDDEVRSLLDAAWSRQPQAAGGE